MKAKLFSLFLTLIMALSIFPGTVFADSEMKVTNISVDGNSVVATVTGGEKICYMVYKNFNIVYQGETPINGTAVVLSIPTGSLKQGSYKISAWCVSGEEQGSVSTFTVSIGNGNGDISSGATRFRGVQRSPEFSRSVMTPYASVYSDISMSHEVAQLTRHEFVMVEWYNDGIAKVRYNIQSGKGTSHQVDDLNGEYVGTGDLTGTGYMYTNAFAIPIVATQEDGQREVCELAYSRLGTKGVYSQTKRYLDVYLDCSALCAWAYYQIGYQIYAGSWSNCVGIGNYLKDHPDAIVWEAGYQQPSCIPEGATNISFSSDQYNAAGGAPAVEPAEIFPGSKSEMEAILEPGDVIMFNHYAPTTCTYTITENGIPQEVPKTEHLMVVQDASTLEEAYEKFGFDHAALYIGDGKIIESSSPSQNTLVSELAGRTNEIVAVYRPLADDTLKY